MDAPIVPYLEAYQEKLGDAFPLYQQLAGVVGDGLSPDRLKAGRVLSARNLTRLKEALETLTEILTAAEPPEEDEAEKALRMALTERIFQRLAIYERDPLILKTTR